MKKLFLLIAILIALFPVTEVLASAKYQTTLTVLDTTGAARTNVSRIQSFNTLGAVSSGMLTSSGLDSTLVSGNPYMLANDRINYVIPSLPAYGQNIDYFQTGVSPVATSMPIIAGTGGYVTTQDNAELEPASAFTTEVNGYVDFSSGGASVSNYLAYKSGAVEMYVSASAGATGTITSTLTGASGVNTQFTTYNTVSLQLTTTAILAQTFTPSSTGFCYQVDIWGTSNTGAGNTYMKIRTTSGGVPTSTILATSSVVDLATWTNRWITYTFSSPTMLTSGTVYSINITTDANGGQWGGADANGYAGGSSYYNNGSWTTPDPNAPDRDFKIYLRAYATISVANQSSGLHDYKMTLASGTLTLYDGVTSIGTASFADIVVDSADNWLWGLKCPYMNYIKYTVGVTLEPTYRPVSVVQGLTYSTGTAAFTNGASTVVGTSTAWTSGMVGGLIWNNTDKVWCKILSVTDASHLVLTAAYGSTGGATAAYTMTPLLPDTTGTYNGSITWGTPPSGLTTSVTGLQTIVTPTPPAGAATAPPTYLSPGSINAGFLGPTAATPTEPVGLPQYPLFHDAATSLGFTTFTLYGVMDLFLAVAIGAAVLILSGSALAGAAGVLVVMLIGVGSGALGWAYLILFILMAGGYLMVTRSV